MWPVGVPDQVGKDSEYKFGKASAGGGCTSDGVPGRGRKDSEYEMEKTANTKKAVLFMLVF